MSTRSILLPLLGVALLGTAACSGGTTAGEALPTGSATSPTASSPGAKPSGAPDGSGVASIQPCELLDPADLTELGQFTPGKEDDVAGTRTCGWNKPRGSDDQLGVGVALRPEQGVKDAVDTGGGLVTGNIGDRDAVQIPNPTSGSCTMALAVGASSRVDVLVSGITDERGGAQRACELLDKVVAIVEPKLPKG